MKDDAHRQIREPDKTGHFDKVRKEAQTQRSQRLGKEAGVRPAVNMSRPRTS